MFDIRPDGAYYNNQAGHSAKADFPEKPMKPVRKFRTIEAARTRQRDARQMVREIVDAQSKREALSGGVQ